MSLGTPARTGSRLVRRTEIRWLVVLVVVEAFTLGSYLALTDAVVTSVRYVLYPFVWMDAAVLAVLATTTPRADARPRLVAAAVATAYFFVLAALAGLVGLELGSHAHAHAHGFQFTMSTPGWGPRVAYAGSVLWATFVPFRVVGYLALSYLVYARLLDASRTALSGVVGVASCVGCGLPLAGSLLAGVGGGASVAGVAAPLSVDLSTLVFLVAVVLLTAGSRAAS
jgi:hypothetical protein